MKTTVNNTVKILFVSAGLLVSSLSMAQRTAPAASYFDEKTFAIAIFPAAAPSMMWVHIDKKLLNRAVRIELVDKSGKILSSENYSRKQAIVRTRFDLSSVGDGLYTFRITDGRQTQERTFKLSTPGFVEQLPGRLITMNTTAPATNDRHN